jgi:hypothetical protein
MVAGELGEQLPLLQPSGLLPGGSPSGALNLRRRVVAPAGSASMPRRGPP